MVSELSKVDNQIKLYKGEDDMLKPAIKKNLYQIIVDQMIEKIKSEEWKPGDKIPTEEELCKIFQVGRNTVRESLKALQILGIIESRAGIGTRVQEDAKRNIYKTDLLNLISDKTSLMELMEMRMLIETQLAYLAAQRANEEDKLKLKTYFDHLQQKIKDNNEESVEKGLEFHMLIAEIARNRFAMRFLKSISEELIVQRKFIEIKRSNVKKTIGTHQEIFDAICNNDPDRAREAMQNHFSWAIQRLEDINIQEE